VAVVTREATEPWGNDPAAGDPAGWQREVDRICDRFEDDWLDGRAPRIEDVLAACPTSPSQRAVLLAELLKLERELRQRRGEVLSASDYLPRFPEHAHVIRALFGDTRVGPYEVIGLIGEGGMGTVYRAYDPRFRRTVALKVIRSSRLDDSSAQSRFRLEAQLAARLEHDHIVPVFDAAQDGDRLFYTMRYVRGRNLAEVINRRPIPGRQAARYIEQVTRAVEYAHGESVLHRDLKPSNILIDPNDRAYVTDFGLAKVLGRVTDVATQSNDRLGTLAYMAPEQARDPTRAVIESDVYSLGATLYEAITGRPPFHAETPVAALEQIERHEPVRPRRVNPTLERDLETICLKCLEKEPEGRYRSATALAEDLRRYLRNEPISARPVGAVEVAKKWVRRNPSLAALAAVTVLLLFAVVTAVQTQRLKNQLASALDSANQGEQRLLDTYDHIITFGERRLADRPEELGELLKLVRDQYGDYLSRHRADAQFGRRSAQILTSLARITDLSGSRASALATYEQALGLWARFAKGAPYDLTLQAALADTWHEIGDLRNGLGRSSDAITAFRTGREIRERLVTAAPGNRAFLSALARSHGYIGDWERENGRREDARDSYAKALEIRERLSLSDPSDLVTKFQLARSYNNGGYLARETGDLSGSISEHFEAEKLQRELAALAPNEARRRLDDDPRNVIQFRDFLGDLALTYNALGVATGERGDTFEAKRYQSKALNLFHQLVKQFPGVNRYAGYRALTVVYLASIADPDQAPTVLADLDEVDKEFARLLRDDPGVLRFRAGAARSWAVRGEILLRRGETAQARGYLNKALVEQDDLVLKSPNNFDFRGERDQTRRALGL
jgi:serine/threonine protein kinase